MARKSKPGAAARRAYALRLQLCRAYCGNPSYGVLEKLTERAGERYPAATIHARLTTGRGLDWPFVKAIVSACYRYARMKGPPPLPEWWKTYEQMIRESVRPEPGWPVRIGQPPRLADQRQPRSEMAVLEAALTPGSNVVLRGLGGVGKTQLAAEAAHRSSTGPTDLVAWIPATSRDHIVDGYARAARELGLSVSSDPEETAATFLAWLAESQGRKWLIVLDNLLDPRDLRGLRPPAGNGSAILTTQRQDSALNGDGWRVLPLGVFSVEEARLYLSRKLGSSDGVDEVSTELGRHPLALAQAAAYMLDRRLTCESYVIRLRQQSLARTSPQVLPDDQLDPVVRAWSMSLALADELRPEGLARPLMELASVLDADGIPAELFLTEAARSPDVTVEDAADGLTCLERLSLVTLDDDGRSVRVHRLVQRAVRESASDRIDGLVLRAAAAMMELWPAIERNSSSAAVLRANAGALYRNGRSALWTDDGLHQAVFRAGNSLAPDRLANEAVDYWEWLLPQARQRLGPEHADTLTVRNNLAWSYGRAGDAGRAVAELQELEPVRRSVLGGDHLNTLATRHGIARWLAEDGDVAGAAGLLRSLVADCRKHLGENHPDTLHNRQELASLLGESGDPAAAAQELGIVFEACRHSLDPDHPDTLDVEVDLARWLFAAGSLREAADRIDRLLTDHQDQLGTTMDGLWPRYLAAEIHRELGEKALAAMLLQDLLDDVIRLHGPERSEIDAIRASLAGLVDPDRPTGPGGASST